MTGKIQEYKTIKKLLRIALFVLLGLLSLPVVVSLLLLVPSVQTKVVNVATDYLSSYLHTEISLGGIYIQPFHTIKLNELLIKDQLQDTLLHTQVLKLSLTSWSLDSSTFKLGTVQLKEPYFNLYVPADDSISNLQFLIDAFKTTDTTAAKPFSLLCSELILVKARFRYNDCRTTRESERNIDFNHLYLTDLSGRVSDIQYQDSVQAVFHGMSFSEQCGLRLRHLSTEAKFSTKKMSCSDLQLVTNLSIVKGDFAMSYDSLGAFQDFFNKVEIEANISESRVNFYDIGFFSEIARDILTPMEFKGSALGTIDNLKVQVDTLRFSNDGLLYGFVRLRGLPDVNAFNIDASIDHLGFYVADFERLVLPLSDDRKESIDLPDELNALGRITYVGRFIGFVNDFVTFGNLSTDLGRIAADLNFKTGNTIQYTGSVASKSFNIGKLIANEAIGIAAFDLQAKGANFDLATLEVNANGTISRLEVLDYGYQNIVVDGGMFKKVFEGKVVMDDPNVQLDFKGKIDLNNKVPQMTFVSQVNGLHLARLNLVPNDTHGLISGTVELDMQGGSLDQLNGVLLLSNVSYESGETTLFMDSLKLEDELQPYGHRIEITSDFGTALFDGKTNLFDLPLAFVQVGEQYAPKFFKGIDLTKTDTLQRVQYDITVFKNKELASFIHPELVLKNRVHVFGQINTKNNFLEANMDSLSWSLGGSVFNAHRAILKPGANGLQLEMNIDQMALSKDFMLEQVHTASWIMNDSLWTKVEWSNRSQRSDSGAVEIIAFNSDDFPVNIVLNSMHARIANAEWISAKKAVLRRDSNRVFINNLEINSGIGTIQCDGKLMEGEDAHLLLDVKNFDLKYISQFGLISNKVEGIFTGQIDMEKLENHYIASSNLRLDSLVIDSFEIGSVEGNSSYNSDRQAVDMNIELSYKELRNVRVVGNYYPFRKSDQLDIEIALNDFRTSIIEPFVKNYVQDLSGVVNGSVSIEGTLSAPELKGSLFLKDCGLKVAYLNTAYSIPKGEVKIRGNEIFADHIKVLDEKNSVGYLNATILHEDFKELNYDIFLQVTDFLALNTTMVQNEAYYGSANVSGAIGLSGYPGYTEIVVEAETKKSKLSIPLTSSSESGDIEYIRFLAPKIENQRRLADDVTLESDIGELKLDFQLSINDEAEVQIIFDEKIGDVIKVRGFGDMLMRIDNRGTFNMFGDYTISGGDYLFTLQNVINKRLTVKSGSHIVWAGDPLDAKVDLTAIYNLRAAPMNLTASVGDTSDVYRTRMPVEVLLNMKGNLMEPDILFNVNLPGLPESDIANQLLDPRTTSKEDLNEQAFSLLLTSNFFRKGSGISALGAGQNTTYEMMSNQFSNWVSQYFDKVDVGVNYRPGSDLAGNQTEVNLTTELFNDRVLVEVNGRVQGANGAATQSNNVAGEFNVEYKINQSMRARVFNEANNYNPTNINQSPYTQGVGLFYRREFDGFKTLFRKRRGNQ